MSTGIHGRVQEAAAFIRTQTDLRPEWGIVLGTGLGKLGDEIDGAVSVPYQDIPGFVTSTVEFHEGRLILGTLEGAPVVAMPAIRQ